MRTATDAEILAYCTKCLNRKGRDFCDQTDCAMFSVPKPKPDRETRIICQKTRLKKERQQLLSKMTAEQQLQYLIERCDVN